MMRKVRDVHHEFQKQRDKTAAAPLAESGKQQITCNT